VEIFERKLRATARIVTGCVKSTPKHGVIAEAGLPSMTARRSTLAACLLAKALSLLASDPLRVVAEASPARRLKSVRGWWAVGLAAWTGAGLTAPMKFVLSRGLRPCSYVVTALVATRRRLQSRLAYAV